ncbi:MAG: hypothetical protein GWN99_06930, partial [Gemmatimonadetes bacterium]|nr:hypothetical protein [Gemmatimonadota bacterium]NIY43194.1 hypothetical protein [Gemmatimonadota bacterium]
MIRQLTIAGLAGLMVVVTGRPAAGQGWIEPHTNRWMPGNAVERVR